MKRNRTGWNTVLLVSLFQSAWFLCIAAGCGDSKKDTIPSQATNPFPGLRVDREVHFPQLTGPRVDVVIDRYGIQHVYADNEHDGIFVQGYLCAHERLFEMEALRMIAQGRLSELVGEIPVFGPLAALYVASEIDLYYRTIFTTPKGTRLSKEVLDRLPGDIRAFLEAYCDGVNAYLEDLVSGKHGARLPTQFYGGGFFPVDPGTIAPYTPESIVSLTLFFLWYLCATVDFELEMAEILEAVGPEVFTKVMRVAPADPTITLPDFMATHWSTRSHSVSRRSSSRILRETYELLRGLPRGLVRTARDHARPLGTILPLGSGSGHSNNWVIGGGLTRNGYPLVCNDPHLSMLAPSNFIMVHIDCATFGSGTMHVAGGAIPGLPGIMLGHNDSVAWAQTAMFYDTTDIYVETILPGSPGRPDSVLFRGNAVPIVKVPERFRLGMKPDSPSIEFTIETVTHHGPILPGSRKGNKALSMKWVGYEVDPDASTDVRTFFTLLTARNIEDIFEAIGYFRTGSGNWVFADKHGDIGFSGHSLIPVRNNQELYPPYLPMPGTGESEWTGFIPEAKLPWDRNPQRGFVTSSNNDVIGTTLDNDPLNDEYYLYYCRKLGFRARRIEDALGAAMKDPSSGGKLTLEHMMDVQADTLSLAGMRFVPHILAAAENRPDRVSSRLTSEALQRISTWNFTTPTGVDSASRDSPPTHEEIDNSISCTIFHAWLNRFIQNSLADEFAGQPLPGSHGEDAPQFEVKALLNALEDPSEAALFDDVRTETVETSDDMVLRSLEEAVNMLERIFGTSDMEEWRWGTVHTATFAFGMSDIILPDMISPVLGPYPNDGADFTVDVGNQAGLGEAFYQVHCPQMRFVTEVRPPEFKTHIVIPCGQSGVRGDRHFEDLMPLWLNNDYVELDFVPEKVIAGMENHFVFMP